VPNRARNRRLALSSRNVYLNAELQRQALALSRSLRRIQDLYEEGERDAARLITAGVQEFRETMDRIWIFSKLSMLILCSQW